MRSSAAVESVRISRFQYNRREFAALGPMRWLLFKFQGLRSRRAGVGRAFSLRTPLADHPLAIRAKTSDKQVFVQIFIDREYRCLDNVQNVGLIVDCGANVGYSAAYLLSRFPDSHVIAIEPESDNFVALERNVRPYGSRCRTVRAGVWSSATPLVVSPADPGDMGEWGLTVRAATAGETNTVPAIDVGTVLEESGFDRISILKVDIEGSETEVFAAHTASWLDKVDNIVIELHGDRSREIFMSAIEGYGYDLSECDELTVCLGGRPLS